MAMAISRKPMENKPTSERRLETTRCERAAMNEETVALLLKRPLHSYEPWHRENYKQHISDDVESNK